MTDKAGVKTTHKDYDENLKRWLQVDDCVSGAQAVKNKTTQYLPDPDAHLKHCKPTNELSLEAWRRSVSIASERYKSYLFRALFYNFTKRTKDGMVGGVFRKEPKKELPTQLEYLITDVDGNNMDLDQQAKVSMDQTLRKGRAGLLVDMPVNDGPSSLADVQAGLSVPRIQKYEAQSIRNWRYSRVGSTTMITMVVLHETYEDEQSEFNYIEYDQYRVLKIDENGNYVQELYRFNDGDSYEMLEYKNIRANGQPLKSIPFFFIGAEENDYSVDDAPLYDLSEINLAHYRNSADNEESSFICGQPTLVLSPSKSLGNPKQWNEANPNGVVLGSRQGINMGEGGSAALLQAQENNLAKQNMQDKEQQAIQIGAELITPSQQETAEAARIKKAADTSVVSTVADNVSDAYTSALKACAVFLGASEDDIEYQLSTDFFTEMMTPQERLQWVSEIMQGVTPKKYYYDRLRKTGQFPADATDEDIQQQIEDEGGVVGGLE